MMVRSQIIRTLKVWVVLLALLPAIPAASQNIKVLYKSGDPLPGLPEGMTELGGGFLNDAGQIILSNEYYHYRMDGVTTVPIVAPGQYSSDVPGAWLNNSGQVYFPLGISPSAYMISDGSTAVELVHTGQAAPIGPGTLRVLDMFPAFNNAGQIAFHSYLGPGVDAGSGLYRADESTIVQIARGGQAAPGGSGVFTQFNSNVALNNVGQVAFDAAIAGSGIDSTNDRGVYLADGASMSRLIVEGQPAVEGPGNIIGWTSPGQHAPIPLNNAGQVILKVNLDGAGVDSSNNRAIYRTEVGTAVQLVRAGDAVSTGRGVFKDFPGLPRINESGQVAFHANLVGVGVDATNDAGIYRADGATIEQLVREGQAPPIGPGVFASLDLNPHFNDAGQIAFHATLSGAGVNATNNVGIYIHDDQLGLLTVVRKGDSLLGSTITSLYDSPVDDLNSFGQLAFNFTLADGRQGMAIYTIPEPATAGLAAIALAALAINRRRKTAAVA